MGITLLITGLVIAGLGIIADPGRILVIFTGLMVVVFGLVLRAKSN
jgi:hypothetical protein